MENKNSSEDDLLNKAIEKQEEKVHNMICYAIEKNNKFALALYYMVIHHNRGQITFTSKEIQRIIKISQQGAYRMLDTMIMLGILKKSLIKSNSAFYELALNSDHPLILKYIDQLKNKLQEFI